MGNDDRQSLVVRAGVLRGSMCWCVRRALRGSGYTG